MDILESIEGCPTFLNSTLTAFYVVPCINYSHYNEITKLYRGVISNEHRQNLCRIHRQRVLSQK